MAAPMKLSDALSASPTLFPLNLAPDGSAVQFVRLTEGDYGAASFLDNRLIGPTSQFAWIPWQELSSAAYGLPIQCHFIFHISHAGSTLMSRLLGLHDNCFSIREPAILRTFAQGDWQERIDLFLGLWSRTFQPQQRAIIKATSVVSEIAPLLMQRVPESRALLMYVPARTFLLALLDGAMSDIESHAATRLDRLQRDGWLKQLALADLSPGELVAMSWLAEMAALNNAAQQFPDRTQWLNFDYFLAQQEQAFANACRHFGLSGDVEPFLKSPLMNRYAKKIEVAYDCDFREKLLAQAADKFSVEVARGLSWLDNHVHTKFWPAS